MGCAKPPTIAVHTRVEPHARAGGREEVALPHPVAPVGTAAARLPRKKKQQEKGAWKSKCLNNTGGGEEEPCLQMGGRRLTSSRVHHITPRGKRKRLFRRPAPIIADTKVRRAACNIHCSYFYYLYFRLTKSADVSQEHFHSLLCTHACTRGEPASLRRLEYTLTQKKQRREL